jgi:hypothetical protein
LVVWLEIGLWVGMMGRAARGRREGEAHGDAYLVVVVLRKCVGVGWGAWDDGWMVGWMVGCVPKSVTVRAAPHCCE